jgi:hypothetical protein
VYSCLKSQPTLLIFGADKIQINNDTNPQERAGDGNGENEETTPGTQSIDSKSCSAQERQTPNNTAIGHTIIITVGT